MPKRMRVVTGGIEKTTPKVVVADDNLRVANRLTANELRARQARKYATTTTLGGLRNAAADFVDSGQSQFYSPQLSTDFLEKPQNLRERRAFYRFFYNTNEVVRRAVDIHSTLPLSKLRLVPPKGKNKHQNQYVMRFFEKMCEEMKLFKTLIEISHEYTLYGNCLDKDAEVRVLGGYKRAEDVQVGDLVLTDRGRYRKVTKAVRRPADQILDIHCYRDFRTLPITEDHPVEVLREDQFVFEPAGKLTSKDFIRITWPTAIEDVTSVTFPFPENYRKVDGGYEMTFTTPHPRSPDAVKARKKLIAWLESLEEPVIKNRDDLSEELGISKVLLDCTVHRLDEELDEPFHRKIGAKGWQRGSQVEWYPIKNTTLEISDSYTFIRKRFLSAADSAVLDNDFCYLVGYWLGDGTLARDSSRNTWGRGLWQICSKDPGNMDRLRRIIQKMFGDSFTEWESNGISFIKVVSNPGFLEWWAENFGETSFGQNKKRVPDWFVNLPVDKLQHFLAGIIDSDGCISTAGDKRYCIVNITMTSRTIMDSVRDISLKCGAFVGYRDADARMATLPNGEMVEGRPLYTISTTDEESCRILSEYCIKKIPNDAIFTEEGKWVRIGDSLALKVKDISQRDYNDYVYNFEVDEDHTYQVAGFSTHNCYIYSEDDDDNDELSPEERAKKKEEAQQRSEYLKQKFEIKDTLPLYKGWRKLIILPPDQVRIRKMYLTDDTIVEYVPDAKTREFITSGGHAYRDQEGNPKKFSIPSDLQEKVRMSGIIPLDTDPYSGSYVFHLAQKKSQYESEGVSTIECCINTLVLLDKLRQAQTSIASRHMTPMRVIWADQLNPEDVDVLREQVDMALVDPDFSIIGNYEIHWEEMGSNGRLLDIEAENTAGFDRLMAGLGLTREILTGEGSYSGSRISLEIMNTQYLLFREILQDYIENYLFKPVAKKKGFIEYDEYGNETLLYPKVSFTRLAIRDNEQFFDNAFQLYQKGSISIDLILDILNIDPDSTREKLEKDLFTVNDSIFNEVLRNLYTNVSGPLVEQTDIVGRLAKYLKLEMLPQAEAEPGAQRFSSEKKSGTEKKASEKDSNEIQKVTQVIKFLRANPALLEKVYANVQANNQPS